MQDEYLDLVNENDEVVDKKLRSEVESLGYKINLVPTSDGKLTIDGIKKIVEEHTANPGGSHLSRELVRVACSLVNMSYTGSNDVRADASSASGRKGLPSRA